MPQAWQHPRAPAPCSKLRRSAQDDDPDSECLFIGSPAANYSPSLSDTLDCSHQNTFLHKRAAHTPHSHMAGAEFASYPLPGLSGDRKLSTWCRMSSLGPGGMPACVSALRRYARRRRIAFRHSVKADQGKEEHMHQRLLMEGQASTCRTSCTCGSGAAHVTHLSFHSMMVLSVSCAFFSFFSYCCAAHTTHGLRIEHNETCYRQQNADAGIAIHHVNAGRIPHREARRRQQMLGLYVVAVLDFGTRECLAQLHRQNPKRSALRQSQSLHM